MARKTNKHSHQTLSRRERQIMDVVYRLREATVAEIEANIPEPPSVDAIRRMAHIREEKGLLQHRQAGPCNVFFPTIKHQKASRHALGHLMDTFFGGSTHKLVAALLDLKSKELSEEDLKRLADMVDQAGDKEDGS